ncbi:MAG: domain S-box protein, partial [Pseudonocardiales bacterium]|nr:domain S-box protein [Pseudonocardiales bacterium]
MRPSGPMSGLQAMQQESAQRDALHQRPLDPVATPAMDALMESGPAVLYRISLAARAVDYISPNVVDVIGLTADMATADPGVLVARIHPDDLTRVRRGQAAVCREDAGVIEYRIRDLRGRWMWVRDHLTLVRDGSGAPLQIVGVVVDVTEDRSFALTLRREHSQLAQLLEMMPVGVVVVDARTRRILIGQRAVAALVGEIRTDLFAQDLERYGGYWPGTDDELGL